MGRKGKIIKTDFVWKVVIEPILLKEMLKSHYRAIPRLIKKLYFNKDKPELMNLKYDPLMPGMLCVIKDNNWIFYDKDYILDTIISDMWGALYNTYVAIPNLEKYKTELICEETFQRIEIFMDEFKDFCDRGANASWLDQKKTTMACIAFLSKKMYK